MAKTIYAHNVKWQTCRNCGGEENPVYMKNQLCRKCDPSERELPRFNGKIRYTTQFGANAGTVVD